MRNATISRPCKAFKKGAWCNVSHNGVQALTLCDANINALSAYMGAAGLFLNYQGHRIFNCAIYVAINIPLYYTANAISTPYPCTDSQPPLETATHATHVHI